MLVLCDSALKGNDWHCVMCMVHLLLQYTKQQVQSCKQHLRCHIGAQAS